MRGGVKGARLDSARSQHGQPVTQFTRGLGGMRDRQNGGGRRCPEVMVVCDPVSQRSCLSCAGTSHDPYRARFSKHGPVLVLVQSLQDPPQGLNAHGSNGALPPELQGPSRGNSNAHPRVGHSPARLGRRPIDCRPAGGGCSRGNSLAGRGAAFCGCRAPARMRNRAPSSSSVNTYRYPSAPGARRAPADRWSASPRRPSGGPTNTRWRTFRAARRTRFAFSEPVGCGGASGVQGSRIPR